METATFPSYSLRKGIYLDPPRTQIHRADGSSEAGQSGAGHPSGSCRERVKRVRPQISYAHGSQPVRRSSMRTWWNLISELTGGIDLILIYMGGN